MLHLLGAVVEVAGRVRQLQSWHTHPGHFYVSWEEAHLCGVHLTHCSNCRQVTAKTKEVETEEDLWQLSQREAGRLQSEKARQQRARQELEERVMTMQKEVLAVTDRMDRFKLAMNFNQVGLAWFPDQGSAAAQ